MDVAPREVAAENKRQAALLDITRENIGDLFHLLEKSVPAERKTDPNDI